MYMYVAVFREILTVPRVYILGGKGKGYMIIMHAYILQLRGVIYTDTNTYKNAKINTHARTHAHIIVMNF